MSEDIVEILCVGEDGTGCGIPLPIKKMDLDDENSVFGGPTIDYCVKDYDGDMIHGICFRRKGMEWSDDQAFNDGPVDPRGLYNDVMTLVCRGDVLEKMRNHVSGPCPECGGSGLRGGFHVRCGRGCALA